MPYTEEQKDNILFRKHEDQKRKGKKLSLLSRLSVCWFNTKLFLLSFILGLKFAVIILMIFVGFMDLGNDFKMWHFLLAHLIGWTFWLIKFFWWDKKKWAQIGKPEFERKTGGGEFDNYFTCQDCKKKFNKHLETEKNLCQKCFVAK